MESKEKLWKIYAIALEKQREEIIYVGITSRATLESRLKEHLKAASRLGKYLRERKDDTPIIREIDRLYGSTRAANSKEAEHIFTLTKEGHRLLNHAHFCPVFDPLEMTEL